MQTIHVTISIPIPLENQSGRFHPNLLCQPLIIIIIKEIIRTTIVETIRDTTVVVVLGLVTAKGVTTLVKDPDPVNVVATNNKTTIRVIVKMMAINKVAINKVTKATNKVDTNKVDHWF